MTAARSPHLATERLILEPLVPELAREMMSVLAAQSLYTFTGGRPPTVQELAARYRGWTRGPSRPGEAWLNWVVRLAGDEQAIGHLQATVVDGGREADIAWLIGTPWQGQGFASEAAGALVEWLEANGVTTVTAHVHPGHAASARVAANAGLARTTDVENGEIVWRRASKVGVTDSGLD